jgi:hypothetical protein
MSESIKVEMDSVSREIRDLLSADFEGLCR